MSKLRLLSFAMWLNLLVVSATAETLVMAAEPCVAMRQVEPPRVISIQTQKGAAVPDGHKAEPESRQGPAVIVVRPAPPRGWARTILFARFRLDQPSEMIPQPGDGPLMGTNIVCPR